MKKLLFATMWIVTTLAPAAAQEWSKSVQDSVNPITGLPSNGASPSPSTAVPNCSDPDVVEQALESRSEGLFGHIDKTWVDLMVVNHATATGVNNLNGAKYCKAYFACDIAHARQIEKDSNGPHPLTAFCFFANQLEQAGNPYYVTYSIRPNGEGSFTVTSYHEPGDPK